MATAKARARGRPVVRKVKGAKPKPWVKYLVMVLLFPFAAVLLPTTLVFSVMMAPTIVAYVTDRSREKYLAITVGLMNLAGTLPAIIALWSRGQSHAAAMDIIGDVFSWAVAYGAAGGGWLIFGVMPALVASYFKVTTDSRIMGIVRRQKVLIADWGHGVADGTELSLPPEEGEEEEGEEGEAPAITEAELVEPAASR
jgi:hypothetical protein